MNIKCFIPHTVIWGMIGTLSVSLKMMAFQKLKMKLAGSLILCVFFILIFLQNGKIWWFCSTNRTGKKERQMFGRKAGGIYNPSDAQGVLLSLCLCVCLFVHVCVIHSPDWRHQLWTTHCCFRKSRCDATCQPAASVMALTQIHTELSQCVCVSLSLWGPCVTEVPYKDRKLFVCPYVCGRQLIEFVNKSVVLQTWYFHQYKSVGIIKITI